MKTFKINLILHVQLIFLAGSVLLISCQQETDQIENLKDNSIWQEEHALTEDMFEQGFLFMLPKGITNEIEEKAFYETAEDFDMEKLIENHRVYTYLNSIGKYEDFDNMLKFGEHLSELDFSKLLNKHEYTGLLNYTVDLAEFKNFKHTCHYEWHGECKVAWPCWHSRKIKIYENSCVYWQKWASCFNLCPRGW